MFLTAYPSRVRDSLLRSICLRVTPWIWAILRKMEAFTGADLHPEHPVAISGLERLDAAEYQKLLEEGPWIDTVVRVADRLVLWQAGGPLRHLHGLPSGWTRLVLPESTSTFQVLKHVADTREPCAYTVQFEGLTYQGSAFLVPTERGDVVVFRASRPLPWFNLTPTSDEDRVQKMHQLAQEAQDVFQGKSAPAARRIAGG